MFVGKEWQRQVKIYSKALIEYSASKINLAACANEISFDYLVIYEIEARD